MSDCDLFGEKDVLGGSDRTVRPASDETGEDVVQFSSKRCLSRLVLLSSSSEVRLSMTLSTAAKVLRPKGSTVSDIVMAPEYQKGQTGLYAQSQWPLEDRAELW